MRTPRLLLTLVIAAGACPPDLIIGAPIPGLFNTGVGANGALLANGAIDPHYRLVASPDASAPGPNAFVITDTLFPIVAGPWLASGPASKWIGPMANQSTGNLPGDYRYRLTFDLTGLEPASAVITGRWTSDNAGVGIFINGQPTGITYDGNFGAFSATFIIDAGFVEGTNTLDFVVNNAGTSANPTGFRAELTGTADPVSPPGTPPAITMHPVGISAGLGDGATFSVAATGARPLSYQWRRNSEPIAGATNATFTLASVSPGDAGAYDAVVSNPWGTATSTAAVLTVVYLSPAERTYEPAGASSRRTGLVFSEIMYHPREHPDGDNLEFIEIYNSNPFAEDISGYRISGDADFTFPGGTVIPGLGRLVVAPDPAKVAAAYGLAGVLGPLT
ncbi:MAG TPA: lamin tail domain-containing protein, partial [Methylomirabilota bacterium]|nr:lamin tail domain-containing protein [Methylomirabilota bacterium]